MPFPKPSESETLIRLDRKIEALEQQARDLARSAETVRQQTLAQSNERIEALEQKARDLASFVETTRQKALLQSDKKIDALEQKARDLADFVETLRNQTRLQSETEIEALGQKARDLALFVETVRNETRLQSQAEIAALGQKARDLAIAVETVREETLLQSDTEIAALGQQARDLAVSVETVREETLLQSENEIAALGDRARILARSVEKVRQQTLAQSNERIEALTIGSAEQALDLSNILESSTEYSIIGNDLDGKILLWNEGAHRIYGYQSDEVVGLANASLLHTPEDVAAGKDRKIRDSALLEGKWEGTLTRVRKNGQRFTARVVITPRRDAQLRAIGFLLISKDISAEVRLTEDLKDRTSQLEAANKELEAFSYSVSHDLRAPLRAIDGFSRILLEDYAAPLPDEAKGFLKLVRDNARQMGQLVDDLLAFSRLGRRALTKHTVNPGKMVRQCLAEMEKEQEDRQMEILIGEMPSCQADPILLKQVWTNLLSNALKYTRKRKEVHIAIGCRIEPRGDASFPGGPTTETVFFVKDNGAGFDMKYANKLFGVFQRLHRAADYDGTGVGLAIVQRIINRHGGRVWGEAQLNQGALFSFTLE
jgi:PAS domain S-box-containing protein